MAIGNALRGRRTRISVTEHWNGTRWRVEPTPPAGEPRPGQGLLAVSCPSPDGCVAVGDYVKATVIERWNGRRWRVSTRLPTHGDAYVGLQDVSCPSTSFCLAVGFREPLSEQFALAYDGSRWSVAPTSGGGETSLQQASCLSSTFCLAVGAAFGGDAASAVAERWNGRRLAYVSSETPPGSGATALSRVSCTSQMSCLALGGFGAGDPSQAMAQSWDGSQPHAGVHRRPVGFIPVVRGELPAELLHARRRRRAPRRHGPRNAGETGRFLTPGAELHDRVRMSANDESGASGGSLVETLDAYLADVPEADQADALHQVFYGFYTRIAIIDRTTYELAEWAKSYAAKSPDAPAPLVEALRDNALYVGQEIFASRLRAMSALAYISRRLAEVAREHPPTSPYTLTSAVAFDQDEGRMRTYSLSEPGAHPDLPYDPLAYDPHAE